jgi:hypothetical protein
MAKTSFVPTAVLGAMLVVSTAALASPVKDADLRAKTICWSYGGTRNTYGTDGSFDSNLLGHGTWSLLGDRLTERGETGVFTFTITMEGRTFHKTGASLVQMPWNSTGPPGSGRQTIFVDVWGSYCQK